MSIEQSEVVKVTPEEGGGMQKCPMCLYKSHTLYRTMAEDDRDAVCGDCFGSWLADQNAEVTVQ